MNCVERLNSFTMFFIGLTEKPQYALVSVRFIETFQHQFECTKLYIYIAVNISEKTYNNNSVVSIKGKLSYFYY